MNKAENRNCCHLSNSSSEEDLQREKLRGLNTERNIHKHDEDLLMQNECEMVPPDGGWGWFVMIGAFLTMALIFFPIHGFGILLSPLFKKSISSSKIGWSISIYSFIFNSFTIFVGPLSSEFGWRKVAIAGGTFTFLAHFLTAFITNPDVVLFIYPIFGGIGGAIGITISFIVVARYFLKRRGFALGFIGLGTSFSNFISPVLANYLLEFYGYKSASLIFGALVLHQCVGGALFQPLQWHLKLSYPSKSKFENKLKKGEFLHNTSKYDLQFQDLEENFSKFEQDTRFGRSSEDEQKLKVTYLPSLSSSSGKIAMEMNTININSQCHDTVNRNKNSKNIRTIVQKIMVSSLKSILTLKLMRVKMVCMGIGCNSVGNFVFQIWIPLVLTHAGLSLETSAWCISISSTATLVGRLLLTCLSDRKWLKVSYCNLLSSFTFGLSIAVFSVAKEFWLFLTSIVIWGFAKGVLYSLQPLIIISISGEEIFPEVFGLSSLSAAIITLIFGPLVGIIRDFTTSFTYAMFFIAVVVWVGSAAWISMPFAVKYDKEQMLTKTSKEAQERV